MIRLAGLNGPSLRASIESRGRSGASMPLSFLVSPTSPTRPLNAEDQAQIDRIANERGIDLEKDDLSDENEKTKTGPFHNDFTSDEFQSETEDFNTRPPSNRSVSQDD